MSRRRVFILGAGFSKQAGMPLATELTALILDGTGLRDVAEIQAWRSDLVDRLAALEDSGQFVPNVEQLFDFAAYDLELWRMKQQLCPVGRGHGPETPWNKVESISAWLQFMEDQLGQVIWDAQQVAEMVPVLRFVEHLRPGDIVITFNYDTLVENALSKLGRAWNHGMDDKAAGGVTVLKMHGSVDWLIFPRNADRLPRGFDKLFSKRDLDVEEHGASPPIDEPEYAAELWRAEDDDACRRLIEEHRTWGNSLLGLAGLGRYKPLHRLPGSAATWYAAFAALTDADEAYVIGFSMSPYDIMARFHLTSVIHSRAERLRRVMLIDPMAESLEKRSALLFGQSPELMEEMAESVDWTALLG